MYKIWLLLCCVFIIFMIWIGGVTRLTNSGLSITEWKPVVGIVPPFSNDAWNVEMKKYMKTPEYRQFNYYMSIAEFKRIYLIEYFHRFSARLFFLFFLIPFVCFLFSKNITKKSKYTLFIILILILIQGFLGWYMVKSGLYNIPHVDHFRLALHLICALIIFLLFSEEFVRKYVFNWEIKIKIFFKNHNIWWNLIISFLVLQIFYGALVAGLKAGLIYNTFPLFNGDFIPEGIWFLQPKIYNLFNNPETVQFIHRFFGIIIFFIALYLLDKFKNLSKIFIFFPLLLLMQFFLGIFTLIWNVPINLASFHQVLVFFILFYSIYLRRLTSEIN